MHLLDDLDLKSKIFYYADQLCYMGCFEGFV